MAPHRGQVRNGDQAIVQLTMDPLGLQWPPSQMSGVSLELTYLAVGVISTLDPWTDYGVRIPRVSMAEWKLLKWLPRSMGQARESKIPHPRA